MDQAPPISSDVTKDEYNQTADQYEEWSKTNLLMQNYCYHSNLNEMI